MSQVLSTLLTYLIIYGYPIVAGCVFIGYLGIPVPSDAMLLAAGALASNDSLNIWILIPLVTITALIGDAMGYWLGDKYGYWLVKKVGWIFRVNEKKIIKADTSLHKWGVWIIFLTRWLLTPAAVPLNIFAGITHFPFKKFIFTALIGEALWGVIFISLGFILGANWLTLLDFIDSVLTIIFFATAGVVLVSGTIWIIKKGSR